MAFREKGVEKKLGKSSTKETAHRKQIFLDEREVQKGGDMCIPMADSC